MFCKNVSTSVFQYLEKRFSKGVRTAGSLTFVTQMVSRTLIRVQSGNFGHQVNSDIHLQTLEI